VLYKEFDIMMAEGQWVRGQIWIKNDICMVIFRTFFVMNCFPFFFWSKTIKRKREKVKSQCEYKR